MNPILDGLFPEERGVALPDLRRRGMSALPFIIMLQNYVSFVRNTIGLRAYFIEGKPRSRSGSAAVPASPGAQTQGGVGGLESSPDGRSAPDSGNRPLSLNPGRASAKHRVGSPPAVRFSEADEPLIDAEVSGGIGSSCIKGESYDGFTHGPGNSPVSGSGSTIVLTDMFPPDQAKREERTEFLDYLDFSKYAEEGEESSYLRAQSRIHGLIAQLTEKELEELVTKRTDIELTPLFMLPSYFFDIVKAENPSPVAAAESTKVSQEEPDPEHRTEDESHISAIALAARRDGETHRSVGAMHLAYGHVLASRAGEEQRAVFHLEAALAIQRSGLGTADAGVDADSAANTHDDASNGSFVEIAATIRMLGKLQERLGNHKAALSEYYEALERYCHAFGKDTQEIADVLKDISGVYHLLERRDACHLLLKKIRLMEKSLRQNVAVRHRTSHLFVETYGDIAMELAAKGLVSESDTLFKACLKLSSLYLGDKEDAKYKKHFASLLDNRPKCPSPDTTVAAAATRAGGEGDRDGSSAGEAAGEVADEVAEAASMPLLAVTSSSGKNIAVEVAGKNEDEAGEDNTSLIWKELNMTSDEVLARRELRQQQRQAERTRLRAVLEAAEAERVARRDAMETPSMLAAAAKKARIEAVRRKREKAEAMRDESVQRRAKLYEMIKTDQITTYFNAVSNDTEGSAHLNWLNQDAADIVDPFANLDSSSEPPSSPAAAQTPILGSGAADTI
jgi:tetratricopeptide (TPR) repeat protein